MNPGTENTNQWARKHNIEGQKNGESEIAFKQRIKDALIERGYLTEAEDAYNNSPVDNSYDALAQALYGG